MSLLLRKNILNKYYKLNPVFDCITGLKRNDDPISICCDTITHGNRVVLGHMITSLVEKGYKVNKEHLKKAIVNDNKFLLDLLLFYSKEKDLSGLNLFALLTDRTDIAIHLMKKGLL